MIRAMILSLVSASLGLLCSCTVETTPGGPPPPGQPPNQSITCGNFAEFQQACTADCSVTWSCESNYSAMSASDQIALDDCSDCLAGNLASGVCADCTDPYGQSCQQFMETLLGVDCFTPSGPPNEQITCGHFADFQQACTANCSVTWDCEASYSTLNADDQIALDDCSDCLATNLASGVCADCTDPYGQSCQQFMEDLLGVNCW